MGNSASNANNPAGGRNSNTGPPNTIRTTSTSPGPGQPHPSMRTKKRSLELPDLASLSLTSASGPHPGRGRQSKTASIPIPATPPNPFNHYEQAQEVQPERAPVQLPSTSEFFEGTSAQGYLQPPSTHQPFPPHSRGRSGYQQQATTQAHPRADSSPSPPGGSSSSPASRSCTIAATSTPHPPAPPSSPARPVLYALQERLRPRNCPIFHSHLVGQEKSGRPVPMAKTPVCSRRSCSSDPVPVKIVWKGGGREVVLPEPATMSGRADSLWNETSNAIKSGLCGIDVDNDVDLEFSFIQGSIYEITFICLFTLSLCMNTFSVHLHTGFCAWPDSRPVNTNVWSLTVYLLPGHTPRPILCPTANGASQTIFQLPWTTKVRLPTMSPSLSPTASPAQTKPRSPNRPSAPTASSEKSHPRPELLVCRSNADGEDEDPSVSTTSPALPLPTAPPPPAGRGRKPDGLLQITTITATNKQQQAKDAYGLLNGRMSFPPSFGSGEGGGGRIWRVGGAQYDHPSGNTRVMGFVPGAEYPTCARFTEAFG
ncbi:hypothetical protein CPB84DRAFT_1753728 [Gymnopilus junonius]|uniref:Uncharacterized protein n=1 Tax=Gymnopilus junonius TaxID=109634 RepID=A0A9P5N9Y8_GYMJU|nr:hypothetical protein CPB84DRAFT_1753728 [Gymnopilus junonius]